MHRSVGLALLLLEAGCFTVAQRVPTAEVVARTPERIARGRYLAEAVAGCVHCHSDHDDTRFGWPVKAGTEGQGGFTFTREVGGVPGTLTAQNITPDVDTGVGAWSDDELMRAVREGVTRDGKALFPLMPYTYFRSMSEEDIRAVVAYLRTLKPIAHATPGSEIIFPVSLFIRKVPKPVIEPVADPNPANSIELGKYLTTIGGCLECHTHHNGRGQKDGPPGGGGWELTGPWGKALTSNITPNLTNGLGRWSREQFIGRFKSFVELRDDPPLLEPGSSNTPMDWLGYSAMSETDLGAIYDYLSTLAPVDNDVEAYAEGTTASR
jgi:cytochrome c553